MKKNLLWIASAVCLLGIVGCSSGENPTVTSATTTAASSSASAEADAAASAEAEQAAEASAAKASEASLKAEQAQAAKEEAAAKAAAEATKKKEQEAAKAAKARIDDAEPLSTRNLAQLVKNPDGAEGDVVVIYGEITQFDAATGTCSFRANIAHKNMANSWDYEHNSIFEGGDGLSDCPKLDNFVAEDEVKIVATSLGSYSYDTQIGGSTTVPKFHVEKISLLK